LIYFSVLQHKKDLTKTAIEEKIHLAETINETIASPLWTFRMALIPGLEKAFTKEMAKFKDVYFVRIVKLDGTIQQSSLEGEWGKTIEDPVIEEVITLKKTVVREEQFLDKKIKAVIYPGYEDKVIWIGFSLAGIEKIIQTMFWRDFLMGLGISLVTILVLFLILKSIVEPLKKISRGCEEIRKGNLDFEIKVKSKTEIGDLVLTFNQMIKDLKKSKEALEEAKASLEIRVAARTKELRELTESLEEQVKERTKELQEKVEELERFHRLAVGRELKMIELKKEIEKLKKKK